MNLRPADYNDVNFFVNYNNGRCTKQNVEMNKIGNMGKQIASYLELPNPELYTGHCFRRSSATLLIDAGADTMALKRQGGWKSTTPPNNHLLLPFNHRIIRLHFIVVKFKMCI